MNLFTLLKKQWDRAIALVVTVVGAIMLISGWVGVSGTNVLYEQAPYIVSGGIGGLFLLGVGGVLWISADLRDEWRKLDRIEKALADGVLRWDSGDVIPETTVARHATNNTRAHATAVRHHG